MFDIGFFTEIVPLKIWAKMDVFLVLQKKLPLFQEMLLKIKATWKEKNESATYVVLRF